MNFFAYFPTLLFETCCGVFIWERGKSLLGEVGGSGGKVIFCVEKGEGEVIECCREECCLCFGGSEGATEVEVDGVGEFNELLL